MRKTSKTFLFAVIIFIISVVTYWNAILCPFIWDDYPLVVDNKYKSINNSLAFFGSEFFDTDLENPDSGSEGYYRPMVLVSVVLDYFFFGLKPWGFHLTNVLIHGINSVLIFLLILILFKRRDIAVFSSVLFAIHPINADVVSYISGRTDSLCLMFMLISFLAYVLSQRYRGSISIFVLSVIAFFLSLASKENAAVLPLLLVSYEICCGEKKKSVILKLIPFAVVFIIYVYLRSQALNSSISYFIGSLDKVHWRLYNMAPVLLRWFSKLVFPYHIYFEDFTRPIAYFISLLHLASAAVLLMGALLILYFGRKNRVLLFGFLWVVITLLPVIHIMPVYQYLRMFTSQHSMYIASIGLYLIAGLGVCGLYRKIKFKSLLVVPGIFLAVLFPLRTMARTEDWRDPIRFYEKEKSISPFSIRVIQNLGNEYFLAGNFDKSLEQFETLIAMDDKNHAAIMWKLGKKYMENGDLGNAERIFKKTIELKRSYYKAVNSLGEVYEQKGNDLKAEEYFKRAVRLNADYELPYYNLGRIYQKRADYKEALKNYSIALEKNPYFAEVMINSANIYLDLGRDNIALLFLKKAMELQPENPNICVNLGVLYAGRGDYKKALRELEKAKKLLPGKKEEIAMFIKEVKDAMAVQ